MPGNDLEDVTDWAPIQVEDIAHPLYSLAISAKRIADRLDEIGRALNRLAANTEPLIVDLAADSRFDPASIPRVARDPAWPEEMP